MPLNNHRLRVALLLLYASFFSSASVLFAEGPSKEEVIRKYEKVIVLAEERNVYREDLLEILPKIRTASEALLHQRYEEADHALGNAIFDLERLEFLKPSKQSEVLRLEWLEIYLDLLQKYLLLAFLAYLAMRLSFFKRMVKSQKVGMMGRFYLALLLVSSAFFLSLFDLKRYGDSAWAFLDYHVILVTVGGFLGGFGPALFSATILGAFRWLLKPDLGISFAPIFAAALLSGLFSRRMAARRTLSVTFKYGTLVGLVHSAVVYLPMAAGMPWTYVLSAVTLLALLEGIAVCIFFAAISSVLSEEKKQEVEQEFLKTQLLFLQAQINPHFLYNALSAIADVCIRGDLMKTHHLIIRLSEFFRRTLKEADDKVSLREEIAHIDSYLEIEKARFGERLRVEKKFEIHEELWGLKIPLLILQPLVENAIKHAISKKKEGGTLRIGIREQDRVVKIEVVDDGKGVRKDFIDQLLAGEGRAKRAGVGIPNIHQRLVRLWGRDYGLRFESELGAGTRVTVSIPIPPEYEKNRIGSRDVRQFQ